jgi:hypothetical protein
VFSMFPFASMSMFMSISIFIPFLLTCADIYVLVYVQYGTC